MRQKTLHNAISRICNLKYSLMNVSFYWYLMPYTIIYLAFVFYLTYFFKILDFRKSFFIYANGVAWYIKNIRMNEILLYDIWVQCYNLSHLHILWQSAVSMQISMCPVLYQSNSMLNTFFEIICIRIYTHVFNSRRTYFSILKQVLYRK